MKQKFTDIMDVVEDTANISNYNDTVDDDSDDGNTDDENTTT